MHLRNDIKTANRVINLTGRIINIYEHSLGDLIPLPPESCKLPEVPDEGKKYGTYYILKPNALEKIRQTGRPTTDIVLSHIRGKSSDGKDISYLYWSKNHNYEIWLYDKVQNF